MYESISKNNELENEMTLDMSYFWYSDVMQPPELWSEGPRHFVSYLIVSYLLVLLGIDPFLDVSIEG